MTTPDGSPPSNGLLILKILLYILAALVLIPGLVAGFSLIASAASITANLLMPLQLFGTPVFNSLAPTIRAILINVGVVVLIISLIISTLLYTAGRLISHMISLETRLARLETRS